MLFSIVPYLRLVAAATSAIYAAGPKRERFSRVGQCFCDWRPLSERAFFMEGCRREDLRKQKQELDAAVAETRQALQQQRQRERDVRRAQDNVWAMTDTITRPMLTIYALADYTAEPAVRFLMDAAKRRKWPPKAEEDLSRLVEEHFLKTDPEALAAWSDVNAPSDAATVKVALKYVEQWRLVAWTRNLNYDSGVAPSTESVLLRLEAARAQLPEELRPAGQGTSADAKARMWAYRWRRRWGARFMKIRARDDVPLKEMQEKAPHFYPPMAPEMVSKVCPFSGRVFRTANTKTSKTGQKTSPFSGHAFVLVFGFTGVAFPSGIGCLALVEFLR